MLKKIILALALLVLWTGVSYAATAEQVEFLISGSLKADGSINSAGKVYTCDAGTTCGPSTSDPKTTWQDGNKAVAHANPIILDSIGTSVVYADGNYKLQIHDSDDNLVETIDNAFYVVASIAVQTQVTLTPSSQAVSTSANTYYCNATAGAVTTDFSGVSAVGNTGQRFTFKKTDSSANTCTIDPLSSQTIDGVTTVILSAQYDDATIESDGSNWTEVRGSFVTDSISERTSGVGVTIDGVLLKDSEVTTDVLNEKSSGVGVTIDSLLIKDGEAALANIIDNQGAGNNLQVSIVNIGAWDMTATAQISKAHGLSILDITSYEASIYADGNSALFQLAIANSSGADGAVTGQVQVEGANVLVRRNETGFFNSAFFNDPNIDRGWITIWYME